MSRRKQVVEEHMDDAPFDVGVQEDEFDVEGVDNKMAVQMRLENDDVGPADPNLITRQYLLEFEGSLNNLQQKTQLTEWMPFDGCEKRMFQSHRHGGTSGLRAESRGGDIENAVLHSMYLKDIKSDFPCPVGVTISGVKGNRYTANGERYAEIILPDTNSDQKRCVCAPSPYINSQYLSMFPGMTRDKLRCVVPPS